MATLLIGYDVENVGDREVTAAFLRTAKSLHNELSAPCSLFIVGKVIEANEKDLAVVADDPLFDFQSHTYSHVLLKTVCMDDGEKVQIVRGGSLEQLVEEIRLPVVLLREKFGKACLGLTGPWGYYRGLSDRPDLLSLLHLAGIRFTRTWARDEKDFQPVAFETQPFWYEPQGFPDILEFPVQGWQDVHWKMKHGWEDIEGYTNHVLECLDYVAAQDLTWCYGTHDWSSTRNDPEMTVLRALIEGARGKGMEILSYLDYYRREKERRPAEAK